MKRAVVALALFASCAHLPEPAPILAAEGAASFAEIRRLQVSTPAADAYYGCLRRSWVPAVRRAAGNHGVYVLRHVDGTSTEFVLITTWAGQPQEAAIDCGPSTAGERRVIAVAYEAVQ